MEYVVQAVYYLLIWTVLGAGLAFVLAAAFFGFPSDEEDGK